ncbi:MAG: M3 family metallopeptidase, partial [Chloroflexota bacterium]|nr:M3 family metallopeptidase [Chloroflexota bacterium]
MGATTQVLPHWDMTTIFPGIDSPEFSVGFQDAINSITELAELWDALGIDVQEPVPLGDETVRHFERAIEKYNDVLRQTGTLRSYIVSFVSTNSRDDTAQAKLSQFEKNYTRVTQLGTRFTAWIGSLDIEELLRRSEPARAHEFMLRKTKEHSMHLISPAEESLAAELNLTSGAAWSRLHGNITSQLMVQVPLKAGAREMPMSLVRTLAYDPDRDTRRAAYEAELKGWAGVAVPIAAALNSIKGEVNTLVMRRNWGSALNAALFNNNIDRETLDAMMLAARESFPDFRRYFKAKARALGTEKLAWYDIFAPVGSGNKVWEYDEATAFVVKQFGTYSDKMSRFAARAFDESWVDAEPRPGKRDGAYCMWIRGGESRVFANFKSSYAGMSTLAHELGHGYH